jgi:hypothetical protein
MHDDTIIRAKETDVAGKIIEGEAILINLANGMYYSMDKVGAHLWSILATGSSIDRLAGIVAAHYDVPEAEVKLDVRSLVHELHAEGLIVTDEAGTAGAPAPDGAVAPAGAAGFAYETPRLVKYDDMADMFALDPPLPELPAGPNGGRS